ncbi:MAG: DUF368 domain-containing protein [Oscillospiraceae bacterium]|nr:DUF368 domain-containing protein [Oscillospiraceae bacterium]
MKHIINILKGAVFGIANIIPGVSGGTMAVIMKVFDRIIDILTLDFKKIKENFIFIIFFGIGAVLGIGTAALLLKNLFELYFVPTQMFFTGVIMGSIPFIFKIAVTKETPMKKINIIPFVIGAVITLLPLFLSDGMKTIPTNSEPTVSLMIIMFIFLFIAAVAMIIPGLSGSMVLMLLGGYPLALSAVTELKIPFLIVMMIGAVLGLVAGGRLISFMLKKFHQGTYLAILGLIIGSLFSVFPFAEFSFNIQGIVGIVLLAAGLFVPFIMELIGKKFSKEEK